MTNKEAFVYKWTHKPSLDWYIGYHKGDPADGYISSSVYVKTQVERCPEDWERTIVDYGTNQEMYDLETEILQMSDARSDMRSLNGHNNENGVMPGWNRGIPLDNVWKQKISKTKTGQPGGKLGKKYPRSHSEEAREKKRLQMMGNTRNPKGRPWSEARRAAQIAKQSKSQHNIQ